MTWHKVVFTSEEVARGRALELQNLFMDLFMRNRAPADAGMFGARAVMKNEYFFSPGAMLIAGPIVMGYAAVECDPPKRSEVALLVSHAAAESIPFAPEITE